MAVQLPLSFQHASFPTAFDRAIREIAPGLPSAPLPQTLAELGEMLRPPGSRLAVNRVIAEALGYDTSDPKARATALRRIQRYRAAEGTAPRGGTQVRGGIGGQLDEARNRLRREVGERAIAEIRRRGVFMRIAGTVEIFGLYVEERDHLPEQFLSPELLSLPWIDTPTPPDEPKEHPAPLDALRDGDIAEAAAGFDNAYWTLYFTPGSYPQGTFTLDVDELSLRLGPQKQP